MKRKAYMNLLYKVRDQAWQSEELTGNESYLIEETLAKLIDELKELNEQRIKSLK